ncbi:hypothetical protein C8R26_13041 [Nitrosomonas oligotropha]|uniref:GmrSD restriction endonucleases N-terminal domain-containing protein n=1 Tax=Nitrosomonas oligotropha TaxID=42354 RepID=A0A2T5HIP7_9PROT|nr:hypothetical protein C8R26_13041 [Nitrosomonas oligotropha]
MFDSLYRRHPVGGLLVWATDSSAAAYRGDGELARGIVKLLLDGQQRITSLYGVIRGKAPKFFDGNPAAFTGLQFNLENETFAFYQPIKMQGNPLWIDVTAIMQKGNGGMGEFITKILTAPELAARIGNYTSRMSRLLAILDIELHIDEVTGADKTLDVVVDIFNRVNSGGTKLSKGDLALAKICADWPEARDSMKQKIKEWHQAGYDFNLDWLLRSVNTVLTGEAKFQYLHDKDAAQIQDGLKRASKYIDTSLNLIAGRLGLDHDQVLFGRFAIPVMVRYLDLHGGSLNEIDRDKLLFWFAQSGMWGRFSGSTESYIDKDLEVLTSENNSLDALLEQLRLWHGGLRIEPGHFTGWSLGARFYPVLYMLTRMGESRDWGTGLPLRANLLGRMNRLEVHHIFPKAQLYKRNYRKSEVNAIANFCFLTKDTNLNISDRLPEIYFSEVEEKHPGALTTQWIPMDTALWRIENYRDFLEQRKLLLAEEANKRMASLLHDDYQWLEGEIRRYSENIVLGGITSATEEFELEELNNWVQAQGLPLGIMSYDYTKQETGEQKAVFDLAWPDGIQEGLSAPIAVMLDEEKETIALASQSGFRCFTSTEECKSYIKTEILAAE